MKGLFLLLLSVLLSTGFTFANNSQQVSPSGNNNVTNICQPQIKVVTNKCEKCRTCQKPKVIYKTKKVYKDKIVVKERLVTKYRTRKNRLRVLGGVGPTGVGAEVLGNKAFTFEETGAVFGLGYDRLLTDQFFLGIQGLTNETFLLNLGIDF